MANFGLTSKGKGRLQFNFEAAALHQEIAADGTGDVLSDGHSLSVIPFTEVFVAFSWLHL